MPAPDKPPASVLSPATSGSAAAHGFAQRIADRMRARFWLKAVGITAYMWLFFVAYFHLLRQPSGPVTTMPVTTIDHWVGFVPWALWPYFSLWLYVSLPPGLLTTTRELLRYGVWVGGLLIAGLACFRWWPSAVPHLPVHSDFPGYGLLRGVDAAGNACPSLHVASATFSAVWLDHLLRETRAGTPLRLVNAFWYGLIVWSTLATKQHVWWDAVAGVALALAFAPLSLPRGQSPASRTI